ncbi:uracil-DNA glycosylase [Actimicrobium sp. CCC2.4]|uniref:uracil-DNA glycosylase n=1 Tax=Actimicrobium sp. CCC2.4 TaxID=3048606 RepID=UPI002AC8E0DB|nr:uracil-DNA glycosylase [Actimicrobium sp. CCC2.4]MEB0133890.1 uracil-DNA glycosylase [Actimicrobium sp. CCC2.4]WPX31431.1 uracil-DNA glycosylase [Actimicrobium sp. CCC2.4]
MTPAAGGLTRRTRFLQALGIGPVWVQRDTVVSDDVPLPVAIAVPAAPPVAGVAAPVVSKQDKAVSAWDDASVPVRAAAAAAPILVMPADEGAVAIARMSWQELELAVASCTRCPLCRNRKQAVLGAGDQKPGWLFVGEGPGHVEDQQGEPFVGPAGKLLDNMLLALELPRGENNYLANAVKCRPVGADGKDRPPSVDESAACRPYLERQIALLQPAVIVALGKVAALSLLGGDPKIAVAALREHTHRYGSIPVVVTYHPAYLLRKPLDKAKSWRDLCLATQAYASDGKLAV